MKWMAFKPTTACAKQPLSQLLRDQLDVQQAALVTKHLDRCDDCQRRLTKLSAEPNWWREAGQWLENAGVDDDCNEAWIGQEFGDYAGPSPADSLLESGLMCLPTNSEMIGSIGRYTVRRVIGTGGTGIVLQAVDTELDRIVAVKVLAPTFASNGPARRRFSREGQAAAAVVHENVVAIHHVESNGPVPFLVMQFVDGCSLQEHVIRLGPMDSISTLRIIAQLASALDAAHAQGLVHRDVKPANVLVGTSGQRVWITDFGLARAVDDASLTRTGFIAGTPHYMSPEQARGESVGPGSDLFGLGSVMYFVLTGRPPFRAERSLAILNRICTEEHRPVREVNPDVPPAVAAIVDRLLEKVASVRYQTASEVRDECVRLLSHPESINERPKSEATERRPRRVLVHVLVGLLVLIGVEGTWQNIHSNAAVYKPVRNQLKSSTIIPFNSSGLNQTVDGYINSSPSPSPPASMSPRTNRPAASSLNNVSVPQVAQRITSESELWQMEFKALDTEFQTLRTDWIVQNSQSTLSGSVDSQDVSFDDKITQIQDGLRQLKTPLNAPTQFAPVYKQYSHH